MAEEIIALATLIGMNPGDDPIQVVKAHVLATLPPTNNNDDEVEPKD